MNTRLTDYIFLVFRLYYDILFYAFFVNCRTSNVPIVGWPPIRSFRKKLASTSKPSIEQQNDGTEDVNKIENSNKGLFVKINMDGIPIGRKVDLNAYDNYEELSLAVDNLFRGLLSGINSYSL